MPASSTSPRMGRPLQRRCAVHGLSRRSHQPDGRYPVRLPGEPSASSALGGGCLPDEDPQRHAPAEEWRAGQRAGATGLRRRRRTRRTQQERAHAATTTQRSELDPPRLSWCSARSLDCAQPCAPPQLPDQPRALRRWPAPRQPLSRAAAWQPKASLRICPTLSCPAANNCAPSRASRRCASCGRSDANRQQPRDA